jgi:hypothetical protein
MNLTPGPWKPNYRRVTPVNGRQDGTDDICHVYGDEEKERANAKLISLAPEMFEVILSIHNKDYRDIDTKIDKIINIMTNDCL